VIGFWVAGIITDHYKTAENVFNYKMIWLIPSGIALGVFLIYALHSRMKRKEPVLDERKQPVML
jgi:hypothetical protein